MATNGVVQRVAGFFAARWRGEVAPSRIFWHDMMLVATALNVLMTFVALALLAAELPSWVATVAYFSMLPYNLFLFGAVWRHTGGSSYLRAGAALWLAAATLL